MSGSQDLMISGSQDLRISGSQDLRLSGLWVAGLGWLGWAGWAELALGTENIEKPEVFLGFRAADSPAVAKSMCFLAFVSTSVKKTSVLQHKWSGAQAGGSDLSPQAL